MRESIGLERSFEKKNLKNLQVYIKIDKKKLLQKFDLNKKSRK